MKKPKLRADNLVMTERSQYDDSVPYEPLPIYVYPEGNEWVASAFGYDLVQRASGLQRGDAALIRRPQEIELGFRKTRVCNAPVEK
jgi:hypothetical protein